MSGDPSLDPADWDEARRALHRALDLAIDRIENIRDHKVWTATPADVRARLAEPAPQDGAPLESLLAEIKRDILPYGTGNIHPRFFGWVHGAGNVAGAMGDMLAGFMNCNVGGRDHVAVHVERQVIDWAKAIMGFPQSASGLLTTGTSMATIIALAVARNEKGSDVRRRGLGAQARPIVGYASSEAHSAVVKACELLGLGAEALRIVPCDDEFRLSVPDLREMIAADRADGFVPAFVVATAGTVNSGAIDDLAAIARLCRAARMWLHVDAAFGGLARLSPDLFAPLAAVGEANSVAFDFHKWLQVPYDCGCVLVRDEAAHRRAFSSRRDYLAADGLALAGGDPWFCEYGPEMSRGFRALKVWLTVKAYGLDALGEVVARNCRQAQYLAARVTQTPDFELLAPPSLNIVCFRYAPTGLGDAALDAANGAIVADLQASGIAAPSTTRIGGRLAIRVCLTNHRTETDDLEILIEAVERFGQGQARRAA